MKRIYIPKDPRLVLNLYFVEFARSGHPIFRHELYGRIRDAVLANAELGKIRAMIKDVITAGIKNDVKISCEVYELVSQGIMYWRKYYHSDDRCESQKDVMLRKGVEDLLPPNRGLYVRSLIGMSLIGIKKMPRTTGELEELRRLLRNIGVPRCSKFSTTQSVLDWVWRGYISINIPKLLPRLGPRNSETFSL